jgi:branched-chain amino acid transport system substrate-binding protein
MKKIRILAGILSLLALSTAVAGPAQEQPQKRSIKIGFNIPLTGDSPKIGEGAKYAAELVKQQINTAGGLDVQGTKYLLDFVYVDNKLTADSAIRVAYKLIQQDQVLAVVGPCGSGRAIPAGEINNENRTPMISPWATNPEVTKNRPYVFRACILDPVQAPAAVHFAISQFNVSKTAILYNEDDSYSKSLAELFRDNWEQRNGAGSVVAFEHFRQQDQNFTDQLMRIINSDAQMLYLPNYYNHVAIIAAQAQVLGWGDRPVFGSDSWGSADLVSLSKGSVKGCYFTTNYAAVGAVGNAWNFINKYKEAYGYIPDDVAALTYDSIRILLQGIQAAGITGNLEQDRDALRDAIAGLKNFPGVTGTINFNAEGDPDKEVVVVKINDNGEFEYITSL